MIYLSGQLICQDAAEAALVAQHLPEHIRLSRAEPGCLQFDVVQTSPLVWRVEECFASRADFDAHQHRSRQSPWFAATAHIRRDYRMPEGG